MLKHVSYGYRWYTHKCHIVFFLSQTRETDYGGQNSRSDIDNLNRLPGDNTGYFTDFGKKVMV